MRNRREVIVAGLAGIAGLVTARGSEAGKPPKGGGACSIPPPGAYVKEVVCLPPGLVTLETAEGETVEAVVLANGTIAVTFSSTYLLNGAWSIFKPGSFVEPMSTIARGGFSALRDRFIVPGVFQQVWGYRHPVDSPGTILRGYQGSPLLLTVDSGDGLVPALTIDLVELDVSPTSEADLMGVTYPPAPGVRRVLESWTVEPGVGYRTFPLSPLTIPWNARTLALVRRTPVSQTVHVDLESNLGALEIVAG